MPRFKAWAGSRNGTGEPGDAGEAENLEESEIRGGVLDGSAFNKLSRVQPGTGASDNFRRGWRVSLFLEEAWVDR